MAQFSYAIVECLGYLRLLHVFLFQFTVAMGSLKARQKPRNTPTKFEAGWAHDLAKFHISMIHRFFDITSGCRVAALICFRARHKDGRPMPFGFLVIFTHRLTELRILNAQNVEKLYSRPFKQMS